MILTTKDIISNMGVTVLAVAAGVLLASFF